MIPHVTSRYEIEKDGGGGGFLIGSPSLLPASSSSSGALMIDLDITVKNHPRFTQSTV